MTKPVKNWHLVHYSDITGRWYLDRSWVQRRHAEAALNRRNQWAYHSTTYRIMDTAEVRQHGINIDDWGNPR